MKYYLVCDAGGTKADYLLFNSFGVVLADSRTIGANAIHMDQTNAINAVAGGIYDCLDKAKLGLEQLKQIVLFIPGFKSCLPMLKEKLQFENIDLKSDVINAFYGAMGNGHGIVVLSGTGSFASGRDFDGNEATCGGWGPLFGDYGSGYHIGIMCLSELSMQFDKGQQETMLAAEVRKQLGISSIEELRSVAYRPDFTREKIADLSYTVAKSAKAGDKTANGILENAAKELVKLAVIISGRIKAQGLHIALIGGITNMGEIITEKFRYYLEQELPECKYYACKYSPIIGAALYILEKEEQQDITNVQLLNHLLRKDEISC
jgi:N-acetylglucosamine kinase-like BadF-type ATPase